MDKTQRRRGQECKRLYHASALALGSFTGSAVCAWDYCDFFGHVFFGAPMGGPMHIRYLQSSLYKEIE